MISCKLLKSLADPEPSCSLTESPAGILLSIRMCLQDPPFINARANEPGFDLENLQTSEKVSEINYRTRKVPSGL